MNPARVPLVILAVYIFRNEPYTGFPADEPGRVVAGLERRQAQIRITIGGGDFDPALSVLEGVVYGYAETQLIHVKPLGAFLIAHEDDGEVQAKVRIFPIETKRGPANAER